jgi:serine/threonine protein kinase
MLGRILDGRYKVVKELAAGGFSQTYLAEDMRLPGNPKCVVKHFNPLVSDPYFLKKSLELFKAEAEILQQLGKHDQIPRLYAYFEEEQEFYLVQEFVAGHPLSSELLPGGKLPATRVIKLVRDVLEILQYVHSCGVIHRDIKPDNLIRRHADGKLVLIDFGTVKQIQSQLLNSQTRRRVTMPIGTPGFMPYEQEQGNSDPSSDIYALGMLALQALTGMHPSQFGREANGEVIWRSHANVSQSLAPIVAKMISYDSTQRYQTAEEVIAALEKLTNSSAIAPSQATNRSLIVSGKVNALARFGDQWSVLFNNNSNNNLSNNLTALTNNWRVVSGIGAIAVVLVALISINGLRSGTSQPVATASEANVSDRDLEHLNNLDQNNSDPSDRSTSANNSAANNSPHNPQEQLEPEVPPVKATDVTLTKADILPSNVADRNLAKAAPSNPGLVGSQTPQAPPAKKFTSNLNYDQLRQSLAKKDWQSADRNTYELLLKAAGSKSYADGTYHPDELTSLSCADIVLIDELWDDASNGKLGFSAQKQIYEAADQDWQKMYEKLGWRTISGTWLVDTHYDREANRWEYVDGHAPNFQAPPAGHLPIALREVSRQSFSKNEQIILRCL